MNIRAKCPIILRDPDDVVGDWRGGTDKHVRCPSKKACHTKINEQLREELRMASAKNSNILRHSVIFSVPFKNLYDFVVILCLNEF